MNRYCFFAIACMLLVSLSDHPAFGQNNEMVTAIQQAYEAQKIDRPTKVLYQLYAGIEPQRLPAAFQSTAPDSPPIKCVTPYIREYQQYKSQFSNAVSAEINRMISASKAKQKSYPSPSRHFTIFYKTSGANAVPAGDANGNTMPDYVEWVAAAADSSWRHEVQTLGYRNPVMGATNPYPIYIENLRSSGTFGYTAIGEDRGFPTSTYIVINSQLDQPNFTRNDHPKPTRGAINVTVAHELKHAIQYANSQWYALSDGTNGPHSLGWSEMDATYMEEVVYDNVNDYYNYLSGESSIFGSSNHSIPVSESVYSGVTWFIYFDEFYEAAFWQKVWTRIRRRYALESRTGGRNYLSMPEAISMTLSEDYGDSFPPNFTRSHLWHFASGSFSAMDFGFSERENYPRPVLNFNLSGRDSISTGTKIPALSAHYIEVDATLSLPGMATFSLENTDQSTTMGVLAYFNDGSTDFKTYNATDEGNLHVKTNWKWRKVRQFGVVVTNNRTGQSTSYALTVNSNIPEEIVFDPNYPNPFSRQTTIPLSIPEDAHVQVKIFDTAGRLVEELIDEERKAGRIPIMFEGKGLASGIYFIQVIINGKMYVQKMTLIK